MNKFLSVLATTALFAPVAAFAQEAAAATAVYDYIPLGVGIVMGLAAVGGTLGQGKAVSAALEAIGRNPSASGEVGGRLILGLALIESLVIISFVVCYLLLQKM